MYNEGRSSRLMPLLKIDNQEIEVKSGTTVLQAALKQGIEIPYYCYHPALEVVGSCRMCLVKVEGMPKLQVSCNTYIGEAPEERKIDGKFDMVVDTKDKIVVQEQKNILEFLLLNHPLDCSVCDQAGECYLQDYSFKYGNAHSRFDEDKRVRANVYLGSQVLINHNRCILCSLCVRFTREISGTNELFVEQRGYNSKIATVEDNPLDNYLAGNVTDICPVGALLSTDYIHKNRIWNLNKQPSVCQDCSVGCNVDVFYQKDKIFRLSPRENHDVNGYFMCDIGRYGFHRYEEIDRITSPMLKSNGIFSEITWAEAMTKIVDEIGLNDGNIAGIASPFHTNETNFLLGNLIGNVIGILPEIVDEELQYPSGFRISGDRSPNKQGMMDVCPQIMEAFADKFDKKNIKLLYVLDDGIDRKLDKKWSNIFSEMNLIIVQTYAMTEIAKSGDLLLPGLAPFEREGTITNDRKRVQWLRPSLSSQGESRPDWEILTTILNELSEESPSFTDLSQVMKAMGESFPKYKDLSFFRIGMNGLSLNGAAKD